MSHGGRSGAGHRGTGATSHGGRSGVGHRESGATSHGARSGVGHQGLFNQVRQPSNVPPHLQLTIGAVKAVHGVVFAPVPADDQISPCRPKVERGIRKNREAPIHPWGKPGSHQYDQRTGGVEGCALHKKPQPNLDPTRKNSVPVQTSPGARASRPHGLRTDNPP